MNLLDVVLILLCGAAGLGGYRLGFVARAISWLGMAIGIFAAARLLAPILGWFEDANQFQLLAVAVGTLVFGAFVGQAVGIVIGSKLRYRLPTGPAVSVDRGVGALSGVLSVAILLWLILPTMANAPGWPADQARNSVLAAITDEVFPPAPDTLQALRRLVGEEDFPQVFDALSPAPTIGDPPAATGIPAEVIEQVSPSTVKVTGVACNRLQEGTGFAAAPNLVVTNAHVVAGEDATEVERSDGTRLGATVVVFDPNRDLAVLAVPGLDRTPLPIGETDEGGTGGVFGHPGGGDLRIAPFEVGDVVNARGFDIYDAARTERQVLIIASGLRPGDSGSALVNDAGEVVGVAFAIAPDDAGVAYALTTRELGAALQENRGIEVDTGPCL